MPWLGGARSLLISVVCRYYQGEDRVDISPWTPRKGPHGAQGVRLLYEGRDKCRSEVQTYQEVPLMTNQVQIKLNLKDEGGDAGEGHVSKTEKKSARVLAVCTSKEDTYKKGAAIQKTASLASEQEKNPDQESEAEIDYWDFS